ncbi:MAG: hypothetical protein ACRDJ5_01950 [Actinomycetota bacterium]
MCSAIPAPVLLASQCTRPRPEVFLKDADCRRTVAFGDDIFVRGDSSWTVPEPELGLILDATGTIVAYTIGND